MYRCIDDWRFHSHREKRFLKDRKSLNPSVKNSSFFLSKMLRRSRPSFRTPVGWFDKSTSSRWISALLAYCDSAQGGLFSRFLSFSRFRALSLSQNLSISKSLYLKISLSQNLHQFKLDQCSTSMM